LLLDLLPTYLSKSIKVLLVEAHVDFNALFSVSNVYIFICNVIILSKCI
jgi:hypothetical protein